MSIFDSNFVKFHLAEGAILYTIPAMRVKIEFMILNSYKQTKQNCYKNMSTPGEMESHQAPNVYWVP